MSPPRQSLHASNEARRSPLLRRGPRAVGPPLRNGHAVVLARIVDVIRSMPRTIAPPVVALTALEEEMLREADAQQLTVSGLRIALRGSPEEWRAHLVDHFRLRYGLRLDFDARADRAPRSARRSDVLELAERDGGDDP